MAGVPLILESQASQVLPALDWARDRGIEVLPFPSPHTQQAYRFRRGRHQLNVWVDPDPKRPGTFFVQVPYPPYTWRFWRWSGDSRLFDDVTAAFEGEG